MVERCAVCRYCYPITERIGGKVQGCICTRAMEKGEKPQMVIVEVSDRCEGFERRVSEDE